MDSWISINEKLPEKSGDYLVTANNNEIHISSYSADRKQFDAKQVTHWMPLPQGTPRKNHDWISVKDKLPDNDSYILIWIRGSRKKFGIYNYSEANSRYIFNGNPITHWMPLPQKERDSNEQ